jgi:hypothetical protein
MDDATSKQRRARERPPSVRLVRSASEKELDADFSTEEARLQRRAEGFTVYVDDDEQSDDDDDEPPPLEPRPQ